MSKEKPATQQSAPHAGRDVSITPQEQIIFEELIRNFENYGASHPKHNFNALYEKMNCDKDTNGQTVLNGFIKKHGDQLTEFFSEEIKRLHEEDAARDQRQAHLLQIPAREAALRLKLDSDIAAYRVESLDKNPDPVAVNTTEAVLTDFKKEALAGEVNYTDTEIGHPVYTPAFRSLLKTSQQLRVLSQDKSKPSRVDGLRHMLSAQLEILKDFLHEYHGTKAEDIITKARIKAVENYLGSERIQSAEDKNSSVPAPGLFAESDANHADSNKWAHKIVSENDLLDMKTTGRVQ